MNLIVKSILMSAKTNYSDLKESLTNQFQELAKLSRKEDKTPYRQAVRALNKLNIRQFIRRVKEDKWDDINIPPKMVNEFIKKGRIKELGRTAKRQGKKPLSKKTKIARKRIVPVINYVTKIFRNAKRIEPAGSYRRGTGMLGDLEFVIAGMTSKKIMDTIEASRKLRVVQTLWKGKSKIGLQVATSFPGIPTMQLEFKLSPLKYFGGGLLESTGSKVFNINLRTLARKKGFKLNQYGLWKNKKLIASNTEKAIFKVLGLDYIPPENRKDLLI